MEKKNIFFYLLLLFFSFNIAGSQITSKNKTSQKKKKTKKKKRPTKRQKRGMRKIINRYETSIQKPISNTNPLEKKKSEITSLLANILNNTPRSKNDRERIVTAITSEKFNIKGISLDNNGNIIDTQTQTIILTKDEITKIDVNKEITKEAIKEISEKKIDIIITKSEGNLKNDKGNIINSVGEIIVSAEKINEAIAINAENTRENALASILQPAVDYLQQQGVNNSTIEEIKNETANIAKEVKNQLKESENLFSDINLDEENKESNINNDFILNLDLNNENISELIINSIKYFQPFNDGIIDIFGIMYTFNNQNFTDEKNDNILFNNVIVLKKFALENNQTYKEIKTNIENYWSAIKEWQETTRISINNNNNSELTDIFEKNQKSNDSNSIQSTGIENIIHKISTQIENESFNKKLKTILLYMYGLIVYCETQLKNQSNKTKQNFFTIFVTQLLQKTKIKEAGNIIFQDPIFNKLTHSNIKISFENIKKYFTKKSKEENELYSLMQNTEFNLLLLFNIIITLKPTEKNFTDLSLEKYFTAITDEQNTYEKMIETAEKNIVTSKKLLIEKITTMYTSKNISIINSYLENNDPNSKNMINSKNVNILIPHVKAFGSESKKEYLEFDILQRYTNIIVSIQYINKGFKVNKNYINIYDIDFKTQPNTYTNQLFSELLAPIKSLEPAEKEGPEGEVKIKYSIEKAIKYLDKIEAYKNYNNENDNILELINIIINTINLGNYFKKHLDDITKASQNISEASMTIITKINNYFIDTNSLFLQYLESIYNVITLKRKYIKNFDRTASAKVKSEFLQASIVPAILGAIGTTGYLIGADNLLAGAGHVMNAGGNVLEYIGSSIANNPKMALIFAGLSGLGIWGYNKYNQRKQEHKDGKIIASGVIPESANLNNIQLD
jgi:hypothetical protein